MTNGPRLPPSDKDAASSMSTNTFGTPLTDSSVVGKSGFRALANGDSAAMGISDDQWAVVALREMLQRVRNAVIAEHMRRAAELGGAAWR